MVRKPPPRSLPPVQFHPRGQGAGSQGSGKAGDDSFSWSYRCFIITPSQAQGVLGMSDEGGGGGGSRR